MPSYYRITSVTARDGTTLQITYSGAKRTIPDSIHDLRIPGRKLQIRADGNNRVAEIMDPNGNRFRYGYATIGDCTVLKSVNGPPGYSWTYNYNIFEETSTAPLLTGVQTVKFGHCNLSEIRDGLGKPTTITYQVNSGSKAYDSASAANYDQPGLPRMVYEIDLPGVTQNARFERLGTLSIAPQEISETGIMGVVVTGTRSTKVTDVTGKVVTYAFTEPDAHLLQIPFGSVLELPERAMFPPTIVGFKHQKISYPAGFEEFDFDPKSGMALTIAKDFFGKITEFAYKDRVFSSSPLSAYSPALQEWGEFHSEPTWMKDATNHKYYFAYSEAGRKRVGVIDPEGRASANNDWSASAKVPTQNTPWKINLPGNEHSKYR